MIIVNLLSSLERTIKRNERNFFENTAAVQFDHRALAMATLAATTATHASSRRVMHLLPRRARVCLHATMGLVSAQVALGVATLLWHVPVSLGSAHQANALLVFTSVVGLTHALAGKSPQPAARVAAAVVRGTRVGGTSAAERSGVAAHAAGG